MQRRFRLSSSTDIQRVRRFGKSYAHPLLVLVAHPNELETSRFAVVAGRSVGNAVVRNLVKRRMREALRPILPKIVQGWDIVLLARSPLPEVPFPKIQAVVIQLLRRSHLLQEDGDGERA